MFDRAVWYFGISVENDMDEASDRLGDDVKASMKTHVRQRVLDKYLNPDQQVKGRFRDPARNV